MAALLSEDISAYREALEGFKRAYPGPVIDFDMSHAGDTLGELRSSHPALILAVGVRAAKAAAEGFADLPVVYCMVLDPGVNGIAGSNVTGVTLAIPVRRQIEGFRRCSPASRRLGVVFSPAKTRSLIEEARSASAALGVTLVTESVQRSDQVPDALDRLAGQGRRLVVAARRDGRHQGHVPTGTRAQPRAKASPDGLQQPIRQGGRSARPVARLRGQRRRGGADRAVCSFRRKKPADVPIAAARGTLVVNVGTARNLGIELPASALKSAQQVE